MQRMALQPAKSRRVLRSYVRFDLSQPGRSRLRQIAHASRHRQENSMLDIIVLALGLGFFAAAIGYTYACERL